MLLQTSPISFPPVVNIIDDSSSFDVPRPKLEPLEVGEAAETALKCVTIGDHHPAKSTSDASDLIPDVMLAEPALPLLKKPVGAEYSASRLSQVTFETEWMKENSEGHGTHSNIAVGRFGLLESDQSIPVPTVLQTPPASPDALQQGLVAPTPSPAVPSSPLLPGLPVDTAPSSFHRRPGPLERDLRDYQFLSHVNPLACATAMGYQRPGLDSVPASPKRKYKVNEKRPTQVSQPQVGQVRTFSDMQQS